MGFRHGLHFNWQGQCKSLGKSQRTEELSSSLTATSGRAVQVEDCGSGGLTTGGVLLGSTDMSHPGAR